MSATKLPDAALLGAVADLLAEVHKANHASVQDLVAEQARNRERIDEYGNVLETKFQALEIKARELVAAEVAALDLKNGEPGRHGEPGPVGAVGPAGPIGPQGENGAIGPQGERGENGEAIEGPQGPQGERGEQGPAGWPGERGERGERGEKGDRGEAIQGSPGERGEKGEQGPQGERGADAYPGQARGLYKADAKYRALDVVAFNGHEWRAIRDNPGPLPGEGDSRGWMLSAKGSKGEPGKQGPAGPPGKPGPRPVKFHTDVEQWRIVLEFDDGNKIVCDLFPFFDRLSSEIAA